MKSPFKFLDSYTREDRDIFFGRDREIEELYQKVFESKILLVYGISGTGKTSLINCGLANKFEESDWLPISIRRGRDINTSVQNELRKVASTPLKKEISVIKAAQSVYLDHFKPIYLIFDQFEELFIFGDRQERDEFIQTITQVIHSDIQCKCVFSIREEYLANITEFEEVIDDILDNRMRVEKMTRTHAIEVIEGPCRVHDIQLEEGFAEHLLDKLSPESKEIELTYLQVFLDRIYRMADASADGLSFTNEMIGRIGDVSDLLGSFLEEQIKELEDPDAGMTLLKAFVSVKGTKRQVEDSEIKDYVRALGKNIRQEEITALLQKFINLRILKDKDENNRYELRHDSLAAKIYESITLVEKELIEIRQFIENAFEVWQKRGTFLNREDLEYIAPYEKKLFLEGRLKEFIERCKSNLEAKKRSFRRILAISGAGFLIILSAIAVYSFRYSSRLRAQKLATQSSLQKQFSLPLSYHTAKAAIEKDPKSSLAVKAIFDAFYGLLEGGPYYDSLGNQLDPRGTIFPFSPAESSIKHADFSDDGSLIFGYLENGTIIVWDRNGRELFSDQDSSREVVDMILSPDNRIIAAVFRDSTAKLWNLKGTFITSVNLGYEPLSPKNAVVFSKDSKTFAITGRENQIEFYNTDGRFLYELREHTAPVTGVSFSPDSQYMASSSRDSSVVIWEMGVKEGKFRKLKSIAKNLKAPIWSVNFALNSRWILIATESFAGDYEHDSIWGRYYETVYVMNFNGRRSVVSYYLVSNKMDYPLQLSKPAYHASFTAGDAAIVYNTIDTVINRDSLNMLYPRYRLNFSENSPQYLTNTNRIIRKRNFIRDIDPYTLDGADVSAQGYVASSITGSGVTNMFHFDKMPLMKFEGTQPVFSPDSNYLLCIKGKELLLYPASEKEIIELVDGKKIFGKLEGSISDWRHYVN